MSCILRQKISKSRRTNNQHFDNASEFSLFEHGYPRLSSGDIPTTTPNWRKDNKRFAQYMTHNP